MYAVVFKNDILIGCAHVTGIKTSTDMLKEGKGFFGALVGSYKEDAKVLTACILISKMIPDSEVYLVDKGKEKLVSKTYHFKNGLRADNNQGGNPTHHRYYTFPIDIHDIAVDMTYDELINASKN